VDGRVAPDVGAVAEDAVAAQQAVVSQGAAIAHLAVVADVGAGHEVVAAADDGPPGLARAAVDRDVLTEGVAVPDLHAGRLVLVLEVLGAAADGGVAVKAVVLAHRERADEVDPRADHAPLSQADRALQHGEGPHGHIRGQFRLRRDQCGRVDAGRGGFHRTGVSRRGGPQFLSRRRGTKIDGQRIGPDASFRRKGRTA
jgi:hypothetical protein